MNKLGTYMDAIGLTIRASEAEGDVMYSELEIRLAAALMERGLRFEQQKRVKCGDTTAVLDFLVEDILAVEIDGKKFHDPHKDALRDRTIRLEHNISTLRVPARKAYRDMDEIVCLIAARLAGLTYWRDTE